MSDVFKMLSKLLPPADVLPGVEASLLQGKDHQVLFMHMTDEVIVPEHSHAAQWEYVVEGEVNLTNPDGVRKYKKGEWFFLEEGVRHAGHCRKGYRAIIVFFQPDRYKIKGS